MAGAERLRVATLNVWGLADGLSRHRMPRMDAIAKALPALELDVLATQENWTIDARERLRAGAAAAGLAHAWHRPDGFGGSGLMVCARRPLRNPRFVSFRLSGLPENLHHGDYFGGKGAVLLEVETGAGPVALVDTHLVANYEGTHPDRYHGHRAGQLVELAELLAGTSHPVIALGDFNLAEGTPEHRMLTGLTGLRDVAIELDARADTIVPGHPYRAIDATERIDYVLHRPGRAARLRPRLLERTLDSPLRLDGEPGSYSDHAGLLAEFELLPAVRREVPAADPDARAAARRALDEGEAAARDRRLQAGVAGAVALGASLGTRRLSRRRLLRGAAGMALGLAGAGALTLAGETHVAEIPAYGSLRRVLEALP